MKKITYAFIGLAFACLGFYNLKLTNNTTSDFNLTVVKSNALADDEDEDGTAYKTMSEQDGTQTFTTTKADGTTCTITYSVHSITCVGKGSVDCTPTSEVTQTSSTC